MNGWCTRWTTTACGWSAPEAAAHLRGWQAQYGRSGPGRLHGHVRSDRIAGSDGVPVEHVVRFADSQGVAIGFSAAVDGSTAAPNQTARRRHPRIPRGRRRDVEVRDDRATGRRRPLTGCASGGLAVAPVVADRTARLRLGSAGRRRDRRRGGAGGEQVGVDAAAGRGSAAASGGPAAGPGTWTTWTPPEARGRGSKACLSYGAGVPGVDHARDPERNLLPTSCRRSPAAGAPPGGSRAGEDADVGRDPPLAEAGAVTCRTSWWSADGQVDADPQPVLGQLLDLALAPLDHDHRRTGRRRGRGPPSRPARRTAGRRPRGRAADRRRAAGARGRSRRSGRSRRPAPPRPSPSPGWRRLAAPGSPLSVARSPARAAWRACGPVPASARAR
ncbi:hypothetical protein STENM327S_04370 [Streptomyces tendae]